MKRTLRIGLFLIGSVVSTYSVAQETTLAAATPAPETTTPPATAEGEEKKEETAPAFTLSGSIDTYARTALGTTNPFMGGSSGASSSFANLKGFGLGMANLIASYAGEKAGFTADLVFGPRGRDAVFGDGLTYFGTSQRVINQMFAYYKITPKTTLNLGQYNTFLGYEVISPAVNFHYSTSYLFSYGPFSHTGLRADFDLGNGLVAKAGVFNPTDMLEFNSVNTFTVGGQIGHSSDAGGVWLNVLYGDQDGTLDQVDFNGDSASAGNLFQIDLTTGWNLGDKFYLGFNSSMQSVATGEFIDETNGEVTELTGDATSFFGIAVYPKITFSDAFALGLRAEYFGVKKGHLPIFGTDPISGDGSITAITLSANYKVSGLTIIPEIRMDSGSEDSFLDSDGNASKSMTSLLLAAVYKF